MRWTAIPLECATERFISGGTPSTSDASFWGGHIPWITGADFNNDEVNLGRRTIKNDALINTATNLVSKGSVLLVTRTGVGKSAIATQDIAISQDITGIVLKPSFNAKFVLYAIKSSNQILISAQRGATIKGVTRSVVKKLPIPFIAISEQNRIVEILDEADRLRRLRREADAKAARILPALFLKMFGDPATNPRGWDMTTVGDIVRATDYGTSTRASDDGSGIPLIRMGNVDYNGHLDLRDLKHVQLSDSEVARFRLQRGDILFNRTNSKELVGKTGLWDADIDAVAASYFIRVRLDHTQVTPTFFWAFMNCSYMKKILLATARGAIGQANINSSELRAMVIYKPPLDQQHLFINRWKQIRATIPQRIDAQTELDSLFSTLLQHAFSGQLTVKWREAHSKELLAEMEQQARLLNLPLPKELETTP